MSEASTAKKPATQIETVKMDDGRVVDFAGKKKLIKETLLSPEGKVQVRMDFRNGETRLFTVRDDMLAKFAAHGASQKLGDEITGLEAIDDCVLAIDELMERLGNGEWAQKREGNGMAGTSVLIRALVESSGKSVEQIKAFLKDKDQAAKIALRNNPKIKPIVERLEAEKAAKGKNAVDTDALLNELTGA